MRKLVSAVVTALLLTLAPVSLAADDNAVDAGASSSTTVNINTATADELDKKLKGIGPDKAQAIVEFRTSNGKFASVDDLSNVKGIGKATVEKNRSLLAVQ
ncbi:helix-hairpin-helix domain-containing protein [Parasalinivibrio latis]|uniref:ComEA family DNA-binding protein n=1 Tax=Parasalinivibrio latis TaxID=2952610 RepID=UPI0030E136E7